MNNNFNLFACAKTLAEINNQSENILGQGACSYHTMGYLLIEAYLKGNPEVKKFVDMLIKNFNDKRKSSNKRLDELFDWVDIEKYPVEALEYNKIFYNKFGSYCNFLNGHDRKIIDEVYDQARHAGMELYKFKTNEITGVSRKFDLSNDTDKNDINIQRREGKILVNNKKWREKLTNTAQKQIEDLIKRKETVEQADDIKREMLKRLGEEQDIAYDLDTINQEIKELEQGIDKLKNATDLFEIKYDFDLDFLDGDKLNINYKGLTGNDYDKWQHYRICNWIGQMFRMYMNEHGKYKNKLKLPFKMQKPKDVIEEYAIVAKKTKKPFVSMHSVEQGYLLYVIDNKKFKPKGYMFDVQDPEIHIYDCDSKRQLDKKEVEDLLSQVSEFSKCDPFCSYSNNDHIQPIINPKKEDYLKQITSVLKYIAEHEKKRLLITKVLFVIGCVITAGLLYLGLYTVNSIRLIYKLTHQKKPKEIYYKEENKGKTKKDDDQNKVQNQKDEKNIDDKQQDKKSDYQTQKGKLDKLKSQNEDKDKKNQKEKGNDEHQR